MFTQTDPHRFRKTVAGISMVVAPLLFLASAIVSPRLDSDEAVQLGIVGDNLDRWYASQMLGLASLVVLVPAILGLMHMLRERESGLGHLGGGLALIGAMLAAAGQGVAIVIWQMAAAGADPRAMTALFERLTGTAGVAPLLFGGIVVAAGLLVLCAGLVRAHAVHGSAALALAVGVVLFVAGSAAFSATLLIVAAAFLTIGLGSIGRQVLAETTDEWEHTPEQHGFTPLAGH